MDGKNRVKFAGLKKIYGYFAAHRSAAAKERAATYRRSAQKVGRNDPFWLTVAGRT
jgi:hypothetical protein